VVSQLTVNLSLVVTRKSLEVPVHVCVMCVVGESCYYYNFPMLRVEATLIGVEATLVGVEATLVVLVVGQTAEP